MMKSFTVLASLASTARASVDRPLFVVTRSKNANVVHYDVRLNGDGRVRESDPVSVYWIMRAEDGRREDLTWLERKFAYGFTVTSAVREEGFRLRLAAFDGEDLTIRRGTRGAYRAHFRIAGQAAVLQRIHVETEEGGVTPRVRHVDLFGVAERGGSRVSERRLPR